MSENVYIGRRDGDYAANEDDLAVLVNGQKLDPRLDLRDHSPSGFEWGYEGSGPAQLALAILANEWGGAPTSPRSGNTGHIAALRWYQQFKRDVIAKLRRDMDFRMTSRTIERWKREVEQKLKRQDG